MELFSLAMLTYMLIGLGVWSAVIMVSLIGNIVRGIVAHKKARKSDVMTLTTLFILTAFSIVVVFIHPGLIHMIPSTVAVLEIGSIPPLLYLTEKNAKDWMRLCKVHKANRLTPSS